MIPYHGQRQEIVSESPAVHSFDSLIIILICNSIPIGTVDFRFLKALSLNLSQRILPEGECIEVPPGKREKVY